MFLGYSILQLLEYGVAVMTTSIKRFYDYLHGRIDQERQAVSQRNGDTQDDEDNDNCPGNDNFGDSNDDYDDNNDNENDDNHDNHDNKVNEDKIMIAIKVIVLNVFGSCYLNRWFCKFGYILVVLSTSWVLVSTGKINKFENVHWRN